MNVFTLEKPLKTSAAAQYLGYSLQQLRLCHHLFRSPDGDMVSFEHIDDVAVHGADGSFLLEQTKNTLTGNPLADRSEELWKTLANWADLCSSRLVDTAITRFRIYVVPLKSGPMATAMHSATTAAEVAKVLAKVKKLVDPAKAQVGCTPHIQRFLAAGDALCCQIIAHFEVVSEADPVESVRLFLRPGAPPEALHDLTAAAIGLARDRIDTMIRRYGQAIENPTHFRRAFQTFASRANLRNLLVSMAPPPGDDSISSLVSSDPVFVRQLKAIHASDALLVAAVSDFLRVTADKVHWADEGRVLEDSFTELDAQLIRHYIIVRDEVEDVHAALDEPGRGRQLYRGCIKTVLPLEGQGLPNHFVSGAYNHLAEDRQLGWHPHYAVLFPPE